MIGAPFRKSMCSFSGSVIIRHYADLLWIPYEALIIHFKANIFSRLLFIWWADGAFISNIVKKNKILGSSYCIFISFLDGPPIRHARSFVE